MASCRLAGLPNKVAVPKATAASPSGLRCNPWLPQATGYRDRAARSPSSSSASAPTRSTSLKPASASAGRKRVIAFHTASQRSAPAARSAHRSQSSRLGKPINSG